MNSALYKYVLSILICVFLKTLPHFRKHTITEYRSSIRQDREENLMNNVVSSQQVTTETVKH